MKWLHNLDDASLKAAINQASIISGIPAASIEKDLWVTLVLKLLFTSQYARHFVFKGGTSLSKGWGAIERFSEDIDIALNLEAFNEKYKEDPSHTFVKKIRRKACAFARNELLVELENQFISAHVPSSRYSIQIKDVKQDLPDADPQVIFIHYHTLYERNQYLTNSVKIEFTVRSQNDPSDVRNIYSLLQEYFPYELYAEEAFTVKAIQPVLTFVEKILLLHELFNRSKTEKIKTHRMSRHYYDLHQLEKNFTNEFPSEHFIERLIRHRKHYSRINDINYETMRIGHISIVPPDLFIPEIEEDYDIMRQGMLYNVVPDFSEIIQSANRIQAQLNGLRAF